MQDFNNVWELLIAVVNSIPLTIRALRETKTLPSETRKPTNRQHRRPREAKPQSGKSNYRKH